MSLFLANPWGLAALAAVPALLLIHALRQRSRRIPITTLFLVEADTPPPAGGLRLEKLERSVPLALQILAACAIAWLLAEPRWIARRPRQTVAVVLDSSASMGAFRETAKGALAAALAKLGAAARRTDWHLLSSGPRDAPLYAGDDLPALLDAVGRWRPVLGTHDPSAALATAAGLAPGGGGTVVFVTDHDRPVPDAVGLLAVGRPLDNVGFTAGDVLDADDGARWRAVIANPSARAAERTLRQRVPSAPGGAGDALGEPLTVRLEPGEHRTLEAAWPAGADRVVLELSADEFTFDDRLALVRPRPRGVRVAVRGAGEAGALIGRMLAAAPAVTLVAGGQADIVVAPFGTPVEGAAVLLAPAGDRADGEPKPLDPAPVVGEDHPLVANLGWGGLLTGEAVPVGEPPTTAAVDQALLWKGDRPLAVLRSTRGEGAARYDSLLLAWDVDASTAARLPALVVLLHRFADRVRAGLDEPWAGNVVVGEAIEMPAAEGAVVAVAALATPGAPAATAPFVGRAPDEPALFTVGAPGAAPRMTGAAQFADARESDFRAAVSRDTLASLQGEQRRRESLEDPWIPAWLALVAAALAGAWGWPAWRSGGRP